MDKFTKEDLDRLIEKRDQLCVSMYMPAHRSPAGMEESRIRLKNMLVESEKILGHLDPQKTEKNLRRHLETLRGRLASDDYWLHLSDGLAVFASSSGLDIYRLPLSFREFVAGARRFYIKPLIPLIMDDGYFYLLTLSQNGVKLFKCSRFEAMEIKLPNIPGGLEATLKYDDSGKPLQFHTRTAEGQFRRSAMFHGQGASVDNTKDDILKYFTLVDRDLQQIVSDDKSPLVLAGVEYLLPIYRQASKYKSLWPEGVDGYPEDRPFNELHQAAWETVKPHFLKGRAEAADKYLSRSGTGLTSNNIDEILPAAAYGRVDTLFVSLDRQIWGAFDRDKGRVLHMGQPAAESEDLLDLAAAETIAHGGGVYAVEPGQLPDDAPAAALYRY